MQVLFGYIHNWTHIANWCVVGRGSKNEHSKDTCLKDIGLCLQVY